MSHSPSSCRSAPLSSISVPPPGSRPSVHSSPIISQAVPVFSWTSLEPALPAPASQPGTRQDSASSEVDDPPRGSIPVPSPTLSCPVCAELDDSLSSLLGQSLAQILGVVSTFSVDRSSNISVSATCEALPLLHQHPSRCVGMPVSPAACQALSSEASPPSALANEIRTSSRAPNHQPRILDKSPFRVMSEPRHTSLSSLSSSPGESESPGADLPLKTSYSRRTPLSILTTPGSKQGRPSAMSDSVCQSVSEGANPRPYQSSVCSLPPETPSAASPCIRPQGTSAGLPPSARSSSGPGPNPVPDGSPELSSSAHLLRTCDRDGSSESSDSAHHPRTFLEMTRSSKFVGVEKLSRPRDQETWMQIRLLSDLLLRLFRSLFFFPLLFGNRIPWTTPRPPCRFPDLSLVR